MKEKYKKKKILHHLETRSRLLSILEAAKLLKDFPMISLLEEENILEKALYHNPCVTMYIAKSKMAQSVTPQNAVENAYEVAFAKLTSEIEVKIFDMKQIADMSSLHQLFLSYLPSDVPRAFSQKRLRRWLEKHYGKRINIEMGRTGQGISSLVISSEVNVCEAVRTKALSAPDDDLHFESSNKETLTDDQILHRAAAILRKDINEMKIDLKTYPDSSEVSIENSLQRIPSNLNQFILWLIDDNCHRKSQTATNGSKMRQSLAISECLVSLSRDTFTPFHLALALHVHHEYGSKNMVELLHSHGFCASYTEVRRFLTSVADCEISRHCSNDTSLSAGLVPVRMGGLLIQEGADNVDINSETIDGKDTFHSMARVIFQERAVSSSLSARRIEPRFSRGIERSLKQDDSADAILRCFSFQKPSTRPEPPKYTDPNDAILACSSEVFPAKDIMWVLLRTINRNILPGLTFSGIPNVQKIPFWTGFNASISKPNDFYNVAVYEPIIDGKPSEMATVYTAMERCIAMSKRAGQSHSIQTFDQQLYSIAQQVKWAHPDLFDTHILRLGGFHMLSCYIASIGKLWADGGLRDLLVDSGVYAGNTVEHMLNGKEFNRGVRALTLVFETLVTLQYQAFWNWCFQQERLNEISDAVLDQLKQFHLNYQVTHDQESFIRLEEIYRTSIDPMIDEFRTWGCSTSPTFQYWDMLIQAIQVMLSFIRAEREGTWSLHLKAVADMIPYFFVTNRTNYCRWTPVYLLDMISLPDEVRTSFNEGKFAIRQIPGFFNGIWSDMATEKTVIKDMKGDGGIVGMTQNKSALLRWSMTKHTLAAYSRSLQDRTSCGVQSSQVPHQEVSPASMKRDEEHVQQLLMHFEQNMTDPFEVEKHPPCLLNVSSGMLASKEVQESLLTALNQGYAMLVDFLQRSFDSNTSGSFYKPIPKSKLKSFATMSCKARSDTTKGSAGHVNPEILFRRALLLSHVRPDVSLETVLSYPVGPVPISLFHEDGSIRKTNKSELATQLETLVKREHTLTTFEGPTILLRDAMGIVQCMDGKKYKTFGDLAMGYLNSLLNCFSQSKEAVDVFDRYDIELSIKGTERNLRAQRANCTKVYQVLESRGLPDLKKFLAVEENKRQLLSFLGSFVEKVVCMSERVPNGKTLYMTGAFDNPDIVKKFTTEEVNLCEELGSTQEEVDTRIILHLINIDSSFKRSGTRGSEDVEDGMRFLNSCRRFVARLYDAKSKYKDSHGDLNKLRYKLATAKEPSLARLSPSEMAFREHVERARLQSIIWLNADVAVGPSIPPTDHGWSLEEGTLCPVPFKGNMTGDILNELICF